MKTKLLILFVFVLISFSTANALIAYLSIEDLAEMAEFVVIGKITKVSPVVPWYLFPFASGYDRFLFDVTLYVEDDLDGKYDKDTITFRIVDSREEFGTHIEDEQNFKVGERVLVFIGKKEPDSVMGDAYVVAGVTQGKYTIEGDNAYGADHLEGIALDDLISYMQSLRQGQVFRYPVPGSGIIADTLPIKKQFEVGLRFEELKCDEGFLLIQKHDGSPACVRPETKQRLIEQGWAKPATIESKSIPKDAEIDAAEKLLSQNQIEYMPNRLVVMAGAVIRGDPRCGAVIDVNSTTHWFAIDSISNPQKMTLYSENPNPCQVNTDSCFCDAQMELTALTLDSPSYFSPEEEEKFANILIDYLAKENINRTPKFLIGKFNINYTDPSAIGYCGELWGYNTIDYFDGAIVNDRVKGYGLERELSPLCAIAEDAKWWERK